MIDKTTGFVRLDFDKIIKPRMPSGEVRGMNIGESRSEINMGNGWSWYNVSNVKVSEQYFLIAFGFHNDILTQLILMFNNSKYDLSKGWESYSEKENRQNADIYTNWLEAELGSERTFGWGEVWAGYDQKGGGSSIGIMYKI